MNMKRILYLIAGISAMVAVSSCDMFKYDNFDGPNAQITGNLLDIKTGEKIGVEAGQTTAFDWSTWSNVTTTDAGALVVVEQGWAAQADQFWLVRFDGQYTNNIVFAGTYKFSTKKIPCYESENNEFTLAKGKNRMDISLLPFCRIIDPKIKYDAAAKKIVASFYVELGDPSKANQISNVALCANTQVFVGCNYQNLAKNDGGAKAKNVKPGELITLEIDTQAPANGDLFKYTQDRYVRLAAMAVGNGENGQNLYNFSPIYKISADYSTIDEVKWEENEW